MTNDNIESAQLNIPLTPELHTAPTASPEDAQQVRAAVEALPLIDNALTGYGEMTPEEKQATWSRYEATLPDDPQVMFDALGIPQMAGMVNEEATVNFRKEDTIVTSPDQFRVVTNETGTWLLKALRRTDPRAPKLDTLRALVHMQEEVIASRIAAIVGYPMPETHLVQMDGNAWLASRFIPNARDFFVDEEGNYVYDGVTPHSDGIDMRPTFNALIVARCDSAIQGIVDQTTGQYYAVDCRAGVPRHLLNKSKEEIYQDMLMAIYNGSSGRLILTDAVHALRGRIKAALESGAFAQVFADRIGPEAEKAALTQLLETRAELLLELFDNPNVGNLAVQHAPIYRKPS
ncbi:hypothetical protein IRY61_04270 [Candidatus Saccharibacteria bacterium]|nr:hypothetical protein [Candidatus Saccharibacteria bacterium]